MASQSAREKFRRRVKSSMQRADEAFRGQYADEVKELLGFSKSEIEEIMPDTTGLETYNQLIEVVKEASRTNADQAELKNRIESLGDAAVDIAGKVSGLARLF